MTAEEKAKELWHKFLPHADNWDCYSDTPNTDNNPAKCAVILCDEMLAHINDRVEKWFGWAEEKQFWEDVKREVQLIGA